MLQQLAATRVDAGALVDADERMTPTLLTINMEADERVMAILITIA